MRRRTHILAPAFVVGALLLGGYRLAANSPAASPAAAAPAAIAPAAIAAITDREAAATRPSTGSTQAPASADEIVQPTSEPTEEPSAAPEPTSTATQEPTVTATVEPTSTSTPVPSPTPTQPPTATPTRSQPTAKPALVPPSRIVAPVVGLDTKVVTVGWHEVQDPDGSSHTEWDVPSYAAGWNKVSARPGEVGNVVLTGHNNIEGEVFRNLEKFQLGDEITVYAGDRAFKYYVTDKFTVAETGVTLEERIKNARWIGDFPDERLTLVSCWPPTNNTHRIVIIAKPQPAS